MGYAHSGIHRGTCTIMSAGSHGIYIRALHLFKRLTQHHSSVNHLFLLQQTPPLPSGYGRISALLTKNAILIVPPEKRLKGFYLRHILVPNKVGNTLRPILDLRALNKYISNYKLRMLTNAALIHVRPRRLVQIDRPGGCIFTAPFIPHAGNA